MALRKKTGGREQGTPNRTTAEARKLLEEILLGQIDNINECLENLKAENGSQYLFAVSRLLPFILPKKTETTQDIPLVVNWHETRTDNK